MSLSQDDDWPPEARQRSELKQLDEVAQCSICHDTFTVPLSLPCGHSFCSGCIRSNIEFQERTDKPRCPQCRKPASTQDLRPNIALGNLAQQYLSVRRLLVSFAEEAISAAAGKGSRGGGNPQKRNVLEEANAGGKRKHSQDDASHECKPGRQGERQRAQRSQQEPAQRAKRGPPHGEELGRVEGAELDVIGNGARGVSPIDAGGDAVASGRRLRKRKASQQDFVREKSPEDSGERGDKDFAIVLSESDFSSEPTPVKRPRVSRHNASNTSKANPPAKDGGLGTPGIGQAARVEPPKAGYVQCPSCSMTVRETLLNHHLDTCLDNVGSIPASRSSHQGQRRPPHAVPHGGNAGHVRMPTSPKQLLVPSTLVFGLLRDSQLKEKLRALGLPTVGKRAELEQRYRDFRVAVQKANDAGEVTTYKALAQQWKAKAAAAVAASSHPMPVPVKPSVDKDGQKLESSGASFEALIRATKEREARGGSAMPKPTTSPRPSPPPVQPSDEPKPSMAHRSRPQRAEPACNEHSLVTESAHDAIPRGATPNDNLPSTTAAHDVMTMTDTPEPLMGEGTGAGARTPSWGETNERPVPVSNRRQASEGAAVPSRDAHVQNGGGPGRDGDLSHRADLRNSTPSSGELDVGRDVVQPPSRGGSAEFHETLMDSRDANEAPPRMGELTGADMGEGAQPGACGVMSMSLPHGTWPNGSWPAVSEGSALPDPGAFGVAPSRESGQPNPGVSSVTPQRQSAQPNPGASSQAQRSEGANSNPAAFARPTPGASREAQRREGAYSNPAPSAQPTPGPSSQAQRREGTWSNPAAFTVTPEKEGANPDPSAFPTYTADVGGIYPRHSDSSFVSTECGGGNANGCLAHHPLAKVSIPHHAVHPEGLEHVSEEPRHWDDAAHVVGLEGVCLSAGPVLRTRREEGAYSRHHPSSGKVAEAAVEAVGGACLPVLPIGTMGIMGGPLLPSNRINAPPLALSCGIPQGKGALLCSQECGNPKLGFRELTPGGSLAVPEDMLRRMPTTCSPCVQQLGEESPRARHEAPRLLLARGPSPEHRRVEAGRGGEREGERDRESLMCSAGAPLELVTGGADRRGCTSRQGAVAASVAEAGDASLEDCISDSDTECAGTVEDRPGVAPVEDAKLDGATTDDDDYALPDAPFGCSQPPPAPSGPVLLSRARQR